MAQLHPLAKVFLEGTEFQDRLNLNKREQSEREAARIADEQFRAEQAAEVARRFDQEMSYRQKRDKLDEEKFKLEKDINIRKIKDNIISSIQSGKQNYNAYSPEQMSNAGTMGGDGKFNLVTPDIYRDPLVGDIRKDEVGTAQQIGQANLAMQQPALDYKFGQEKELINTRGNQQAALEDIRSQARAKIEANRQAFQAEQGRLNRQNRLQTTQMRINAAREKGSEPSILDSAAVGDIPVDSISKSKNELAKAMTYAKHHGIGFYTTPEATKVSEIKSALDQFGKVKDFVIQLMESAPAEGASAVARGKKQSIFGRLWDQKLTNAYDEAVKTVAPGMARSLGEKGAFTDRDRKIWDDALPNFSKSDPDNWNGLRTAYDLAYKKAYNTLKDIKLEDREEFLKTKFNFPPVDEVVPPMTQTVNGKKYKLNLRDGLYYEVTNGRK